MLHKSFQTSKVKSTISYNYEYKMVFKPGIKTITIERINESCFYDKTITLKILKVLN